MAKSPEPEGALSANASASSSEPAPAAPPNGASPALPKAGSTVSSASVPAARRGLEGEPFSSLPFFDNPSFGRALRYTFGDKRLGRAVFLNALLLVIALGTVQELWGRGTIGFISERLPFGRAAFLAVAIVETLMASLLGPVSFVNLFNAERREDCFDQVVATGCSPLRILLGRYAAMVVFVSVVAISALPFFVFAASVLRGASAGDILLFYAVLFLYTSALGAAVLATTVAIEDAVFPGLLGSIAAIAAIVPAFSRYLPPAITAWSPVRHLTVQLSDVPRALGYGDLLEPVLFGVTFPTALFSCVLYLGLLALSLAYVCVGPDLELSLGLDAFSSVTLKKGGESSRGRRGLASTLLRGVQLRFFYENLSARMRALGPFLRIGATLFLYAAGNFFMLGMVWPKVPPRTWADLQQRLGCLDEYLLFVALALGLIALASSGSRAAVLARVPVLSLGKVKIGRFPALFVLLGAALAIPPVLFGLAAKRAGLSLSAPEAWRALSLYGILALYAVFTFSVGLVWAMVTTNPYSAMGNTLLCLVVANLVPLGWVPLFASNVVTEESGRVLDASPVFAGWAVYDPSDKISFPTVRDEQTVTYDHQPGWKTFVALHAPLALLLLGVGLGLERRDARTRRFLGALSIGGAFLLFSGEEARAQDATPPPAVNYPVKVELETGLGGKVPWDGFTPLAASLENTTDKDIIISLTIKEPTTGAVLRRIGPEKLARGEKRRLRDTAVADGIHDAASLLVEVTSEDGALVGSNKAKVDALPRTDHLLVVLDKRGSLPFAVTGSLRTAEELGPRRAPRVRTVRASNQDALTWTPSYIVVPDQLPSRSLGWSGAGAVFLGDLSIPDESQARALMGFVARGGSLVIAVGDRAAILKKGALGVGFAEALDGLPDAPPRREVSLASLIAPFEKEGADPVEPASAVAVLAPGPRDQVLARSSTGEPVITRRSCGLGTITLVAFDPWQPPLLHREATARIIEQSLARPGELPGKNALMRELSQLRVQPARLGPAFAGLLLYALFVGPGIFFGLKPKRKGLLAWVLIPASALLLAAITPAYKLVLARAESAEVAGSLVSGSAGDPWEVELGDAILFSGGSEQHDLGVRRGAGFVDATAATLITRGNTARPDEPLDTTPETKDSPFAIMASIGVPLWGSRHILATRFLQRAPARIEGALKLRQKGVQFEIKNAGNEPLEDPVIVYPEFLAQNGLVEKELATLQPGMQVSQLVAQGNVTSAQALGHTKELSETLARAIVDGTARSLVDSSRWRTAILVARLPDRSPLVEARQNVRVRANGGVLIVRLPYLYEERVPFGIAVVTREERESIAALGSAAATGAKTVAIETRLQLPHGSGTGAPPDKMRLEVAAGVRARDVLLGLKDTRTGEWVPIDVEHAAIEAQETQSANAPVVVTIPNAARFLDAEGVVQARQELDPALTGTRRDALTADLDLSLEWAPHP